MYSFYFKYLSYYPTQYLIIWSLIALFILAFLVIFFLIFIHRISQDANETLLKYSQNKIDTFLTNVLNKEIVTDKIILNFYNKNIVSLLKINKRLKNQLLTNCIALYDKLEGQAQQNVMQIIDVLQLKKIILQNLKNRKKIIKLQALHYFQKLQMTDNKLTFSSNNKLIKNKLAELVYTNNIQIKNQLPIENNWQKSSIFFYLLRYKNKKIPIFIPYLYNYKSVATQQFAVEMIHHLGLNSYEDDLVILLNELDFANPANNNLIIALINAIDYFDEEEVSKILKSKISLSNIKLKETILLFLQKANIA